MAQEGSSQEEEEEEEEEARENKLAFWPCCFSSLLPSSPHAPPVRVLYLRFERSKCYVFGRACVHACAHAFLSFFHLYRTNERPSSVFRSFSAAQDRGGRTTGLLPSFPANTPTTKFYTILLLPHFDSRPPLSSPPAFPPLPLPASVDLVWSLPHRRRKRAAD